MNATLIKALVLLVVAGTLLVLIASRHSKMSRLASLALLTGTGCWAMVALAHLCEALMLLPAMGWGREHSVGHYLDLASAAIGTGLLLTGLALQANASRQG